jgi:glycosyltransferase involved in cell wall biosynthesis
LPVVGTNVEGIQDVISHNSDGLLIDPGNVEALKDALVLLLKDQSLRQRFGRAGREKAVEKYSLRRCVNDYERLFLSVCSAHAWER